MSHLPEYLFFTGVPGSKWSGISQIIEQMPGVNTSDHNPEREYTHGKFSGHKGAYFGKYMTFEPLLYPAHLSIAWNNEPGMKIVKSHDWALRLDEVVETHPDAWIMLVYRPDHVSYAWWHEAGGFSIEYPSYAAYGNSVQMLGAIQEQNQAMLKWSIENDLSWSAFTPKWFKDNFGYELEFDQRWDDVLVTMYKGR